jgi:predicted enzyme related to lactoylglutathione lyase
LINQHHSGENIMGSKLNWFEIPVANIERAVKFYSDVFKQEMRTIQSDETRTLALMPPGAGVLDAIEPQGSLLQTPNFEPSDKGAIIYFDPVESLDVVLERVEAAGGKVTFPKFRIGHGHLAVFTDSEGNAVGLLEWDAE